MPVLQAHNISHQFDNGETLFEKLSCSMTRSRVGLIGRNGVGKSVLASILCGGQIPTSGTVTLPKSFAVYRQQPSHLLNVELSVAQFLGKDKVLSALKRIESGDCSEHLYDIIGEQWDAAAKLNNWLSHMGLPTNPDFPCAKLSGGQLARLQLCQCFDEDVELLVLDEPSNHLDEAGKRWLLDSMHGFGGAVLLISHDRELLRDMDEIWELTGLGLQVFGGNYDVYAEQKRKELHAIERQISSVERQKQQLAAQAQRNKEKAEQRASQGNKLRNDGSQPKVLVDSKKDKATARASNRSKNEQLRQTHLQEKEQALRVRKEHVKEQKLYLKENQSRSYKAISLLEMVLPFGNAQPLSIQILTDDKIHLLGNNGAGKSTLLKTLLGQLTPRKGECSVNSALFYLDQHFGAIRPDLSMFDNLMHYCQGMSESDARTLLAGIGFRRDSVFQQGDTLSGGEKMKLAMLVVSNQSNQPLLLLDEPDNHLDIDSKIMLAEALNRYRGGFILISHDTEFAKECGVNRFITL